MVGFLVNVWFWSALNLTLNQQAQLEPVTVGSPVNDGDGICAALSLLSVVSVISAIIS